MPDLWFFYPGYLFTSGKMISKKPYIKPEITRIVRDSSIVLMQVSDPDPQGNGASRGSKKSPDEPFASPFRDKPFN